MICLVSDAMHQMLCATLALCVAVCSAQEHQLWWKTAVFYQVYPRSFKDSDGDGVGDIKGIIQGADHFKEIGVDAIWLSPFYRSPMADFGYDISDFTAIDPLFGTMDDFDALVAKLKSIDVKLVVDFVPNHSSDEHEWFQKSLNMDPDYVDFYVWHDDNGTDANGTHIPPNNWMSYFGGSAWEWRDERKQFYLHKFAIKQPDLNYRIENVVTNMTGVIKFWLDRGVDGFRMDAAKELFEDKNFPNEPAVPGTAGNSVETLQRVYESDLNETFEMLRTWGDLIYQRVQADGRPRAVFLEIYDTLNTTIRYFGSGNESLEFPFNFFLLTNGSRTSRPLDLKEIIDEWMAAMPDKGVPNWTIGNHDNGRVADRYGTELVDALNLLTGVLPGIKVTYYGEEIGMQNTFVRWDETVDVQGKWLGPDHYLEQSRDPERTPMQWDTSLSAGFSNNSTCWLPVNPNYWWLNVAAQKTAETSHLKVFQAMTQARQDPVFIHGDLNVLVPDNDTLVVLRSYNESHLVLVINMGSQMRTYTAQELLVPSIDMTVVVGSINSGYSKGTNWVNGSLSLVLRPKAAVLLKSGLSPAHRLLAPAALLCAALLAALSRHSLLL